MTSNPRILSWSAMFQNRMALPLVLVKGETSSIFVGRIIL
jgi:hypothetical protein